LIRLSKRLQAVAHQVKSGGVVADIGCDHGFTSIYLVQQQLARRVIALDINKGPLERADEHVTKYHLQESRELRLSDGVEKLSEGEADTLLISGMGGSLICRILDAYPQVTASAGELVLSPQSEISLVRHYLLEHGFAIDGEQMLKEQGKYYVVIHGVHGSQQFLREEEYLFGQILLQQGDCCLQEYLQKEKKRMEHILHSMGQKELSSSAIHQKEILTEKLEQVKWSLEQCEK
jgi:tRNA (adenine22-N1)-methyltransferase